MISRSKNDSYLSITQLARGLNAALEEAFSSVAFEGEIFQLTRAGSGHLYFTLKDDQSQVQCAMWRSMAQGLTFEPEVGAAVQCVGRPNVYNKTGRLQVIVQSMRLSGEGDLQKKFLQLKEKLEKEGLFSPDRKRPLPFFPRGVGVVTSGTGAVIHDIMVKIQERMPSTQVYLVDVRVQGEGAAEEIAAGIEQLNSSDLVDVIIVGRGGGSLEDLWSFNEEVVVRAVFASRIPIVSGVGHESDVALSDLAADVRAPTPTAAAELVVPHRNELLKGVAELDRRLRDSDRWFQPLSQSVDDFELRLVSRMDAVLQGAQLRLQSAESALKLLQPSAVIQTLQERLEGLALKLDAGIRQTLSAGGQRLALAERGLASAFPLERITHAREVLERNLRSLSSGVEAIVKQKQLAVQQKERELENLSPQRVLERGYSIAQRRGKVVRTSSELQKGERIDLQFAVGRAEADVIEIKE